MSTAATPETTTLKVRGMDIKLHTWKTTNEVEPKGIVIAYHGFLAHGRYPTVRYAAELLHENGYHVVAPDMPGHGESEGMRGYLPSADVLIDDAVNIARHVISNAAAAVPTTTTNPRPPPKKFFLVGSSMGGTIALRVAMELKKGNAAAIAGVILLAPMLAIKVGVPARMLLKGLSYIFPTVQAIPSSSMEPDQQYRDEAKRKECVDDPLCVSGKQLRIASASTCVEMATEIQKHFAEITVPLLCMVADQDTVVDPSGTLTMYEEAKSEDKTLKRYEALHGLLCEPKPLLDEIQKDLIDWINARSQ